MISYMLDTQGYLIINRDIVTEDIDDFEYTPKPEYEGPFIVFNEKDEEAMLQRWFSEMKLRNPDVYVTFNGDFFDMPYVNTRAQHYGIDMKEELGFTESDDGEWLSQKKPHIDCLYWVKRDSYLPQGSQGLKVLVPRLSPSGGCSLGMRPSRGCSLGMRPSRGCSLGMSYVVLSSFFFFFLNKGRPEVVGGRVAVHRRRSESLRHVSDACKTNI